MNEGSAAAPSAGGRRRIFARRIGIAVGTEFARLEIAPALAELAALLAIAVGPIRARPAVLLLRAHRPVLTLLVAAARVAALLRLTLAFDEGRLRAGAGRGRLALHIGLRRERRGVAFGGRSEAVGDTAAEVLVVLDLDRLPFARRPTALGVGLGGLGGGDEAEIVLGVLQVVLGRDRIAAGVGIARELQVLLGDVVGVAADLHVGPVRFIRTGQRIGAPPIVGGAVAAHPLIVVLTRSHRMFLD